MSTPRTAKRRPLWPAVPAVAAAAIAAFVALAAVAFAPTNDELERKANVALLAGDRATARIWLLRLLERDPSNARYQLGLRDAERGESKVGG